ncbi:MAG: cytochrome c biogenesis protein CcsA [Thermodesulfobacteriota bacterium]
MRLLEGMFLWGGVGFYVLSFSFFLGGLVFKKDRQASLGWTSFVAAFFLHTLTIAVRWAASGHPPVLWTYEHALASSWFLALVFTVSGRVAPGAKSMGVGVALFVIMVLGYGLMSQETAIEPLPPPYKSNWLWVHVTFAWLAYSAFAFAAVVAVLHLLKDRALRVGGLSFLERLPPPEALDDLTARVVVFGFVGLTVEMGAGAIWAYGLWGRYWAWDPMETWTLISWLAYGVYMHLRGTMGWRGTPMAWVAIIAFVFIFIAFGGIAMMKGLHAPLAS